jgi:hypothetical protein
VTFINQHALENSNTGGASIANSTLDSLLDIGPSSLLTASRRMLLDHDDDFKHNHSEQHHGRCEGQNLSQPVVSTAGRGSQPPVEDDTLLPADSFSCNPYNNLLRQSECRFDFYATIKYSKHFIVLYPNVPIQNQRGSILHVFMACFPTIFQPRM